MKKLHSFGLEVWTRTLLLMKGAWEARYLMLLSTITSSLAILFWCYYRHQVYSFFGLAEGTLGAVEMGSDLMVFIPGMLYATVVAFVINRVAGQNNRIRSSIKTMNAVLFLEERDLRTQPLMHLMMIIVSLITWIEVFMSQYSSKEIAILAIGCYTFLATFLYLVVIEMDNPFTGVGKIPEKDIPERWMEMTMIDILDGSVPHAGNKGVIGARENRNRRTVSEL